MIKMIHPLLFFLFSVYTINVFAQDHPWSLNVSSLTTVDDNFMSNHSSHFDVGLKRNTFYLEDMRIAFGGNIGSLSREFAPDQYVYTFVLQPKIYAEVDLEVLNRIKPRIGVGYSFLVAVPVQNISMYSEDEVLETTVQGGIGTNIGLTVGISDRIFVHVDYDFIKLDKDKEVKDISYNRNINFLKFGLGFTF